MGHRVKVKVTGWSTLMTSEVLDPGDIDPINMNTQTKYKYYPLYRYYIPGQVELSR